MSDRAKACYDKFKENLALAKRIDLALPGDRAWSCVVRFYAAVHLLNAYLIDKERVRFDPGSAEHPERKKAMNQCPELRDAPKRYRHLRTLANRFATMLASNTRTTITKTSERIWIKSSRSWSRKSRRPERSAREIGGGDKGDSRERGPSRFSGENLEGLHDTRLGSPPLRRPLQ